MLRRIAQLAADLAEAGPPAPDELEHAATALQALTVILVTRDVRMDMARWETCIDETGRHVKRLRPDNPPTPEERAQAETAWAEMVSSRQAPAASVWDPESTVRSSGKAMSKAEYQAYLKRTGRAEVSGYDIRNDTLGPAPRTNLYTEAEVRALVERALEHGKATGQITPDNKVVPNAPVIPLPVAPSEPRPRREVEREPEASDRPFVEEIPLAERKPVDTSKLEKTLYENALAHATKVAIARSGGI